MSGDVVAIVPIRSLSGGKTRLAPELTTVERAALMRRMLRTVVTAALDSGAIGAVAVISPDPEALALAASLRGPVHAVAQDADKPGLNPALAAGREWAEERGASAMLILFGDLPLLTGSDVQHMVRRDAPVVIAPDRHGTGTNALLLRLGRAGACHEFAFQFGEGSYARHVDEAHHLGLEVATSIATGTAFDLDTPADLKLLSAGAYGFARERDATVLAAPAHGEPDFDNPTGIGRR